MRERHRPNSPDQVKVAGVRDICLGNWALPL